MRFIRTIVAFVFFAGLCAGLVFVIQKNREEASQETTEAPQEEIQTEVKGDEKLSVEEEAIKRLPLTPANIVWYTNQHRAKSKLPALIQRKALNESSKAKTANMILYQYFDHTQPGGEIGFDRFIDDQNYEFVKIGENLAMGDFSTSKEVVDAWIKSPTHNRNLLDATYTEIGVSIQQGRINGRDVTVITQHFGKPRKSCPTVSESTKKAITSLTTAVQKAQDEIRAKEREVATSSDPDAVAEYNSLVTVYNVSANQLSQLIKTYNAQVKAFDACAGTQ